GHGHGSACGVNAGKPLRDLGKRGPARRDPPIGRLQLVVFARPGYLPGLGEAVRAQPGNGHVVAVSQAGMIGLPALPTQVEPVELASVGEPDLCRAVRAAPIDQAPPRRPAVAAEPQFAVFGVLEYTAVCRRSERGRAAERAVLTRP